MGRKASAASTIAPTLHPSRSEWRCTSPLAGGGADCLRPISVTRVLATAALRPLAMDNLVSLEFQHIAHAYTGRTGRVEALSDIAFTAPTGKITCLLGSSGSGKSTLLNLAAGLLPVQSGSIRVGGEEIASANRNPPPEARPVGLVFQDGALFPHMTIAKNIAFGLSGGGSNAVIEQWLAAASVILPYVRTTARAGSHSTSRAAPP